MTGRILLTVCGMPMVKSTGEKQSMKNFTFYIPTRFIFGKDEENNVGTYVREAGGTNVLIHYGGGSVVRSGLLDRVKASLAVAGIAYEELGGVQPNPKSGLIYQGIELCREKGIDFILAVGGGSTIDSSKAIAAGAVYDGDFWDFYQGKWIEKSLPVATILTIAAAGSEGNGDTVVTREEDKMKRDAHGDAIRPRFTILNPALTQTVPPYQTISGIADIMAHLFERYFTNTKEVETSDRLIEALLLSVIHEAPRVVADPDNYDARANIMWAGMLAHNDTAGVDREQDWASHNIEHELSGLYDCTHGAGLAVIFPAWMKYVYKHDVARFAQIAVRVWGCQMDFRDPEATALAGIAALQNFWKSLGLPSTLGEVGGKEEDIDFLAKTACYGDVRQGSFGGFVELKEADVKEIYRLAL